MSMASYAHRARQIWRHRSPRLPPVLATAVLVEVGLRTLSLPTLCRILGIDLDVRSAAMPGAEVVLPRWSARSVRAVDRVLRPWPFGDTCLRRCLVLGRELRTLQPVLRIGVRLEHDRAEGHSWLEIDGVPLDAGANRFASFGGED